MTDNESPDVEEIKTRLGEDIPVEEEILDGKSSKDQPDVVNDLGNLGRQFGETLSTAWNSEERKQFESEMRQGVDSFVKEADKAFRQIMNTDTAGRLKEEASKLKPEIDSNQLSGQTKSSIASGLQWLSDGLSNLANQFTPAEKSPPEDIED